MGGLSKIGHVKKLQLKSFLARMNWPYTFFFQPFSIYISEASYLCSTKVWIIFFLFQISPDKKLGFLQHCVFRQGKMCALRYQWVLCKKNQCIQSDDTVPQAAFNLQLLFQKSGATNLNYFFLVGDPEKNRSFQNYHLDG